MVSAIVIRIIKAELSNSRQYEDRFASMSQMDSWRCLYWDFPELVYLSVFGLLATHVAAVFYSKWCSSGECGCRCGSTVRVLAAPRLRVF